MGLGIAMSSAWEDQTEVNILLAEGTGNHGGGPIDTVGWTLSAASSRGPYPYDLSVKMADADPLA